MDFRKKVIICIHGFKNGDYHDFDYFYDYTKLIPNVIVDRVHLYDYFNPKTFSNKLWYPIVEQAIQKYSSDEYEIHLIVYSMTAGMAAYVSRQYRFASITMIAPYFHLLGTQLLKSNLRLLYKFIKLKYTQPKSERREKLMQRMVPIPLMFTTMFFVMKNRKYVKKITSPLLVISGLKDEYISFRSVEWAYFKSKSKIKSLIFDDETDHLFLFKKELAGPLFDKILAFQGVKRNG